MLLISNFVTINGKYDFWEDRFKGQQYNLKGLSFEEHFAAYIS